MCMILLWTLIFIISVAILLKGSDWLVQSKKKIGLVLGISPFILGFIAVGFGTSFPELVTAIASLIKGVPEIIVPHMIGSYIANSLLVLGAVAISARRMFFPKETTSSKIVLLVISSLLFLGVLIDGAITFTESLILFVSYGVYLLYEIFHQEESLPVKKERLAVKDILYLVGGLVALIVGSKYLVDSIIAISVLSGMGFGVFSLGVLAVATAIPELIVVVRAGIRGDGDFAIGALIGSSLFGMLMVVGLSGLFTTLPVDEKTLMIGVPAFLVSLFLIMFIAVQKRIDIWQGALLLMLYILFIGKLSNLL